MDILTTRAEKKIMIDNFVKDFRECAENLVYSADNEEEADIVIEMIENAISSIDMRLFVNQFTEF